ncbi:hypothetical protein MRX96_005222 [Rhipicephalus microplus]
MGDLVYSITSTPPERRAVKKKGQAKPIGGNPTRGAAKEKVETRVKRNSAGPAQQGVTGLVHRSACARALVRDKRRSEEGGHVAIQCRAGTRIRRRHRQTHNSKRPPNASFVSHWTMGAFAESADIAPGGLDRENIFRSCANIACCDRDVAPEVAAAAAEPALHPRAR